MQRWGSGPPFTPKPSERLQRNREINSDGCPGVPGRYFLRTRRSKPKGLLHQPGRLFESLATDMWCILKLPEYINRWNKISWSGMKENRLFRKRISHEHTAVAMHLSSRLEVEAQHGADAMGYILSLVKEKSRGIPQGNPSRARVQSPSFFACWLVRQSR